MAGLGTLFIAIMGLAAVQLWRGRLPYSTRLLWVLMLAFPFPYIANTAGWMTAELGRQPWLVYGLMRTVNGVSPTVHSGTALFTLIGFCGLYLVLGLAFLFLVGREIAHGPSRDTEPGSSGSRVPKVHVVQRFMGFRRFTGSRSFPAVPGTDVSSAQLNP